MTSHKRSDTHTRIYICTHWYQKAIIRPVYLPQHPHHTSIRREWKQATPCPCRDAIETRRIPGSQPFNNMIILPSVTLTSSTTIMIRCRHFSFVETPILWQESKVIFRLDPPDPWQHRVRSERYTSSSRLSQSSSVRPVEIDPS